MICIIQICHACTQHPWTRDHSMDLIHWPPLWRTSVHTFPPNIASICSEICNFYLKIFLSSFRNHSKFWKKGIIRVSQGALIFECFRLVWLHEIINFKKAKISSKQAIKIQEIISGNWGYFTVIDWICLWKTLGSLSSKRLVPCMWTT